jgi:hypothetical protein
LSLRLPRNSVRLDFFFPSFFLEDSIVIENTFSGWRGCQQFFPTQGTYYQSIQPNLVSVMVVCRSISVFWCYYSYNLHFGRIAATLLTGLEGFDNCGTVSGVPFSQSCFFVVIYVILRVSTGVFKNFEFFFASN